MITTTDSQYEDIKQNAGNEAAEQWLKDKKEEELFTIFISEEKQND